jgi:DNA-binding response OmpR family regulator
MEGYQVIKAVSPEEAERVLERENIHLMILDIRMVDDNDPEDTSGIELAQDERFRRIPKIFVTGYPTFEAVRQAYGPIMKSDPIALAFLAKKEGPKPLVEAVNSAFQDSIGINWDLAVLPDEQGILSFTSLALTLDHGIDPNLLAARSGELEDLFRKLFSDEDQISLVRLNWFRGGCGCLMLYTFKGDTSRQAVVLFGPWAAVKGQFDRATEVLARSPGLLPQPVFAESLRYAALAYSLPDTGVGPLTPGPSFFKEAGEKLVKTALESLYEDSLNSLHHQERAELAKADLAALYRDRLRIPALRDSLDATRIKLQTLAMKARTFGLVRDMSFEKNQVEIAFTNGEIYRGPDPLAALVDPRSFRKQPAIIASTFGGIRSGALLIDMEGKPYPVDLSSITRSPVLEDYVSLECEFRFERIISENLFSLLDFEKQLCGSKTLNDFPPAANVEPECRKSLTAIQTLRKLAGEAGDGSLEPYLIGLFHYIVQPLLVYDAQIHLARYQTARLIHRLMSASLVLSQIERLAGDDEKVGTDKKQEDGLKIIEASREVTVDGREVRLTQTEFKLLLYLYKNANRLCSRDEILSEVFELKGSASKSDKGLLNTHIDRLRKKVNINPAKHNYIVTIRGEGYMLDLKP